ncbi:MAG: helix-turn-helix domain-containing protein [Magnetococcales bacterium]|nr:helix-turn-helix domain-containing protein [Magnetococcales bacterium]
MESNGKVILDALEKAGKPLKSTEVAALTGLDQKEVGKLLAAMKKEGKVASPKMCYYAPAG